MKRIQNCADYMNLAGQFYFKNNNITHEYGLFTSFKHQVFVVVKFKMMGK